MTVVAELRPMAKKKMGRPKTSQRDDATARIDRAVLAKMQMVAKARNTTVAEYLTELVRSQVDRDLLKEMKKLESDQK
jgi:uncharacterized protein (DUF4415 family)